MTRLEPDGTKAIRLSIAIVALIADCWLGKAAQAQAKVEASYTISAGVLTIGSIMMSADLGGSEYKISANGRTRGFVSVLSSGQASYATHGRITENRLVPESFSSSMTAGSEMLQVMILFNSGSAREMTVTPRIGERVPLTEADRHGVVDPLTAMFIPAGDMDGRPTQSACNRTLPIFDGYQRYDLKLSFKRLDTVDIKEVHDGPVVVCAVMHEPIAGISHQYVDQVSFRSRDRGGACPSRWRKISGPHTGIGRGNAGKLSDPGKPVPIDSLGACPNNELLQANEWVNWTNFELLSSFVVVAVGMWATRLRCPSCPQR